MRRWRQPTHREQCYMRWQWYKNVHVGIARVLWIPSEDWLCFIKINLDKTNSIARKAIRIDKLALAIRGLELFGNAQTLPKIYK